MVFRPLENQTNIVCPGVGARNLQEDNIATGFWTIKTWDGNGRPSKADLGIYTAVAFDFPQSDTTIVKQIAHLKSHSQADSTGSQDESFLFSGVPLGPELQALVYLTQSMGVAF